MIISLLCFWQFTISCVEKTHPTNLSLQTTQAFTTNPAIAKQDQEGESLKKGWKEVNAYYTYHFTGKIDNRFAFDLNLQVLNDRISGSYYYLKYEELLKIEGKIKDNYVEFTEESGNTFKGIFDYNKGEVTGYWTNTSTGESLPFTMVNPKGKSYAKKQYRVLATEKSYASNTYYISQIEEIDQQQHKRIIPIESQFWETEIVDKFDLYIEDYNFDGYLDLCTFHSLPSKYAYFTYDPTNKNYVENEQYSHLNSPPFTTNFRKQLLYFHTEYNEIHRSLYQYHQGWLRKIYHAALFPDPNDDWAEYFNYVNGETLLITPTAFESQYGKQVVKTFEEAEEGGAI